MCRCTCKMNVFIEVGNHTVGGGVKLMRAPWYRLCARSGTKAHR